VHYWQLKCARGREFRTSETGKREHTVTSVGREMWGRINFLGKKREVPSALGAHRYELKRKGGAKNETIFSHDRRKGRGKRICSSS